MPWVKLDDGFLTNPKIMRAGLEGRALYIAGLCYCAGGLTDGVIPVAALPKLGVLADVRKPAAAALQLVAAGLWESADDGYRVHDYLKYQPSAADVQKDRTRVADWRAKRRSERVRNGVQNGDPDMYETRTEHVQNGVRNGVQNASRASTVPARPGLTPSVDGVPRPPRKARARVPDAAPPRHAPTEETTPEPEPLRPAQQTCPLCPEVFPDNAAMREHLDTSPRHKVRPVPEDFGKRKLPGERKAKPFVVDAEVRAELEAMAQRPPLQPGDLPPELLAEHERFLARERQRAKQEDAQ